MNSIGEQELRVRCVSHFVGHRYKKAYFDCITNSHLICDNKSVQDKKTRVKIVYSLKSTKDEADFFSKISLFEKEIVFVIDVDSCEEKICDGYTVNQYKANSVRCEQ